MIRTFLVKRVMKPRSTAKTRPTRVPPILTMRKEAEVEEEEEVDEEEEEIKEEEVFHKPLKLTLHLKTHRLL